jgi:hypothetical protein
VKFPSTTSEPPGEMVSVPFCIKLLINSEVVPASTLIVPSPLFETLSVRDVASSKRCQR